jgi:hypothetical protein
MADSVSPLRASSDSRGKRSTGRLAGLVLAILPVIPLSSCALDTRVDRIILRFPENPPAWRGAGNPRYELAYRDAAGSKIRLDSGPGDGIPITLERGRDQAFLAYPYMADYLWPGVLKPAGAVYPGELAGDELALTWEGGLGASAARSLEGSGYPIGTVDWRRIAAEAKKRVGDPWAIGFRPIAAALLNGSFGMATLKPDALLPVRVPLSARSRDGATGETGTREASWAADSPFALRPVEDGDVYGFCVPGERCFFDGERAIRFSLDPAGRLLAWVETSR